MEKFSDFYTKSRATSIGFFPGGFKPPHAGHFAAVQAMLGYSVRNPETGNSILLPGSKTSDFVHIIIGHSPRGSEQQNTSWKRLKKNDPPESRESLQSTMITKEMSRDIWELYISQGDPGLRDKVNVSISSHASPVIGMEQEILNLDNDEIKSNNIHLYAGSEDQARYSYFISDRFKQKISDNKGVDINNINVVNNMIDRLGSATDARSSILRVAVDQYDTQTLEKFIPAGVNVIDFMKLLKNFRDV